jgi:translation initiation factor 3 subunit J
MKAADAKEVSTSVSAIANEKIKAEKEANTGKKKTGMCFHYFLLKLSTVSLDIVNLVFFFLFSSHGF